MDLEELRINSAGLQTIKNHAFQYVHSLKRLDLSDNRISSIESDAFEDVSILISLQMHIYVSTFTFHFLLDRSFVNYVTIVACIVVVHANGVAGFVS